MNGRILHLVKTFDGATWAALQAIELSKLGWEIHVMSPEIKGRNLDLWKEANATLHEFPCCFPTTRPWLLESRSSSFREKIREIKPELIHSHFVSNSLLMRYALKSEKTPRIFQVPGPLHLESYFFGTWEKCWAQENDWWIASSKNIRDLYLQKFNAPAEKTFLSYYGTKFNGDSPHRINLKERLNIPETSTLIANISYIYPPKRYLGQKTGIKGHELMLEAMKEVLKENSEVYMLFIGSQWGGSSTYFEKLKKQAARISPRIIFTGYLPQKEILAGLPSIDLVIHVPTSENCGGVAEAMVNEVPVIASSVGGLPEVVIHGKTGHLLKERNSHHLKEAILGFLKERESAKNLAKEGRTHVLHLFDVKRTSLEVNDIYKYILGRPSCLSRTTN